MSNATQARRRAIHLLDQVLGEGKLLSECYAAGALDKLPAEERARTQRLATDTLRNLERADRILQKHLKKSRQQPLNAQLQVLGLRLATTNQPTCPSLLPQMNRMTKKAMARLMSPKLS